MSMPWEIYCHQINFKFWNHNGFETGVIDFIGRRLTVSHFYFFPDTTNWYHGLLWQLNNHPIPQTNHLLCLVNAWIFFWFIHTISIRALAHFLKLKRTIIETRCMKRKNIHTTPNVKADWSDSMEMIVQSVKKSVIWIRHILKQNKRVAESW